MRPSSTAAMAGSASGAIFTYHWSVSQGSRTAPLRSPRGTCRVCGSILSSRPAPRVSATIRRAGLEAVESASSAGFRPVPGRVVAGARCVRPAHDPRVPVEEVDQRQAVAPADLVVVEIVAGRDLHAAGAERGVHIVVGDDRDQTVGERQADLPADQVPVALIAGMHGDRRVAQHGLGAGRRDDELPAAVRQRIADVPRVSPPRAPTAPRGPTGRCAAPGPS